MQHFKEHGSSAGSTIEAEVPAAPSYPQQAAAPGELPLEAAADPQQAGGGAGQELGAGAGPGAHALPAAAVPAQPVELAALMHGKPGRIMRPAAFAVLIWRGFDLRALASAVCSRSDLRVHLSCPRNPPLRDGAVECWHYTRLRDGGRLCHGAAHVSARFV